MNNRITLNGGNFWSICARIAFCRQFLSSS